MAASSSNAATTGTATGTGTADKGNLPTLSWLEEDDEFEEFDGEGPFRPEGHNGFALERHVLTRLGPGSAVSLLDWNETEEDLEEISAWNDNWDDDELNDDFSKQLRCVVDKVLVTTVVPLTGCVLSQG